MKSDYQQIEAAIRCLSGNLRPQPTLAELAAVAGVDEGHFRHLIRRWAGVSPERLLQFLTPEYARGLLPVSRIDLEAAAVDGVLGSGGLNDLTVALHAATAGETRSRGAGVTIRYGVHPTPFGEAMIAVTHRGICGLAFVETGCAEALAVLRPGWEKASIISDQEATAPLAAEIFERRGRASKLSLHVQGTNFQLKVWQALLALPEGTVTTYGDLAAALGAPGAARAVGAAVGRNPVAWLIPCHRVIRSTGLFGQYRWGAARKEAMIGWEAAQRYRQG